MPPGPPIKLGHALHLFSMLRCAGQELPPLSPTPSACSRPDPRSCCRCSLSFLPRGPDLIQMVELLVDAAARDLNGIDGFFRLEGLMSFSNDECTRHAERNLYVKVGSGILGIPRDHQIVAIARKRIACPPERHCERIRIRRPEPAGSCGLLRFPRARVSNHSSYRL